MKFQRKLLILILGIVGVSCTSLFADPLQEELRVVYERSAAAMTQARRTLDTSHLSDVFTQNALQVIEKDFAIERQMAQNEPTFIGEEKEVDWIKVASHNPSEAIIEVKYFYRTYTYNRDTGEIIYHDKPRRYWRIFKVKMRQEDNKWKVDETLEFIDWSG